MLNNFVFQSPGDIAFKILDFPIYYYGIILSAAIFLGFLIAYSLFKKYYDSEKAKYILDFSPYLILIGILGARFYYCAVNYQYYITKPLEILNIRQGGLSVHGMILFGIIALYIFAKKYDISFRKLADVFLCGSILAQSIGRWGNFFNSEAFGTPTNLPWKLYISPSHRPVEYLNYSFFHPTFLYESILDLIIFFILLISFKKLSKHSGSIACLYLILYSVVRIIIEALRTDSVLNIVGFPVAQVASFILLITGIVFLFMLKYIHK